MKLGKFFQFGVVWAGLGIVGCSSSNVYKIRGIAEGIEQGKVCIISYVGETVDTLAIAEIKDGKFEIQGNVPELIVATIQVVGLTIGHVPIYLENAIYDVKLNTQNLEMSDVSGGGKSQQIARELWNIDMDLSKSIDKIRDEYIKVSEMPENPRLRELNIFLDSIQQEAVAKKEAFYTKYATSYVMLNYLAQNSARLPLNELKEKYNILPVKLQNSALGKQINLQIQRKKSLAVGQKAPDFTVQAPSGESFTLYSIKAKAKIIDFWASWCTPCRALTPKMIELYEEFHPYGLEIVGISMDDKKDVWIEAIEEEKLPWIQGSKLDGFKSTNSLNQLYGIHGIPHIVLLDENNRIVVTSTKIDVLRKELLKLLKSEL